MLQALEDSESRSAVSCGPMPRVCFCKQRKQVFFQIRVGKTGISQCTYQQFGDDCKAAALAIAARFSMGYDAQAIKAAKAHTLAMMRQL